MDIKGSVFFSINTVRLVWNFHSLHPHMFRIGPSVTTCFFLSPFFLIETFKCRTEKVDDYPTNSISITVLLSQSHTFKSKRKEKEYIKRERQKNYVQMCVNVFKCKQNGLA